MRESKMEDTRRLPVVNGRKGAIHKKRNTHIPFVFEIFGAGRGATTKNAEASNLLFLPIDIRPIKDTSKLALKWANE
jgi:hypothetical protein